MKDHGTSEKRSMGIQAALVRSILDKYQSYAWTIQGFGMARTKIADVGRIHVWDSRLRTQLVSDVHAHPWDLKSTIISGELINQRFTAGCPGAELPYMHSRIATGEGGGLVGEPNEVILAADTPEFYIAGEVYHQKADEIHRSIPMDGTVTLLERHMGEPLQETSVYWPRGTYWISAEPRPAQEWELSQVIKYALERWSAS
jgi:hypothetical protein